MPRNTGPTSGATILRAFAAFARLVLKINYFSLIGMISGATTDPPALAYSNSICESDEAAVAYSTVYPLSMFLRIIMAQLLVLLS